MGNCIAGHMERRNKSCLKDFPSYQAYRNYGNQCTVVPNSETSEHSSIYRMARTSEQEYESVCRDWLENGSCMSTVEHFCKERGKNTCLAYRTMLRIDREVVKDNAGRDKTLETYVFDSKHETISYTQFWNNVQAFGRGLREIGLQDDNRVAIFENTRWEWLTTMYGCWTQKQVVATVYANLGEDALVYALKETACNAIVCNGSSVKRLIEFFTSTDMTDTTIIYLDAIPDDVGSQQISIRSWQSVLELGRSSNIPSLVPTGENRNDLALIMYTSGTTGNPKGVMHTHGSLFAGVRAIGHRVHDFLGPMKEQEWYCSYLPLAHIMEFAVLSVLMERGVIIGFGSPRTLTDQFAKPHGDLTEYKPLIVVAVPRVLDTMRKAVEARLPRPGTLKRRIFDQAYAARLQALKDGKDTPFYNSQVFSAPRAVMGGRVYALLSGGGPLSQATQEFINVVFGMVVQGYGLTETVCVGGIQRIGNLQYDSVGQILKNEEIKLLDTEEYKHTDTPEPRGELCIRGPFLFKGYFNQPELTEEALDSEGWFHTGDVASITNDGTLRIVGRVKALAKNANGEYLALETLESIYGTNELAMPNCVCLLVNPHRSYTALLALTNEQLVTNFMASNNIKGTFPEVLNDISFKKKALASFQKSARDAHRASFEVIQNLCLLTDEWTPENGVLTAAMKLKRRAIDERYKNEIEALFVCD